MTTSQSQHPQRELWAVDLGTIDYLEALELQKRLVQAKKAGKLAADLLLLLEHPPVITLGRRGEEGNVLASAELLAARNIQVNRIGRGGDATYHGLGQLVGYPIINLRKIPKRRDVGRFVWVIQEAIIRTLKRYNISAERIHKVIGVWVRQAAPSLKGLPWEDAYRAEVEAMIRPYDTRKIAAIGARIERWISYHGFALNVNTHLSDFKLIVPCGLQDRGVTSMEVEVGRKLDLAPIKVEVAEHLVAQWGHKLVWKEMGEVYEAGGVMRERPALTPLPPLRPPFFPPNVGGDKRGGGEGEFL